MLVLSRKEDQKIIFPNLGISVEVVRVKGQTVRLGVEAPRSIKVVRSELLENEDSSVDTFQQLESRLSSLDLATRHKLRNHLNTASLSVNVAQKQIERGGHDKAEIFISQAIDALDELNQLFESTAMGGENELPKPPVKGALEGSSAIAGNWTALVVEDNDNERELLAGVLQMAGFEVISVPDGQAAIDYLSLHARPDIVLMDMNMPRLSGPQTISKIRTEIAASELPIFGVSGLTQSEANIPLGDRGVTGWFSKPVNPNQLVKYLQQEIEGKVDPVMN
ncbi:UNVERIFIED_CONTAM: hypothetical protein GTU68_011765 [Idotea baltica]|nr:hypothetical protein [Idotea baltica]